MKSSLSSQVVAPLTLLFLFFFNIVTSTNHMTSRPTFSALREKKWIPYEKPETDNSSMHGPVVEKIRQSAKVALALVVPPIRATGTSSSKTKLEDKELKGKDHPGSERVQHKVQSADPTKFSNNDNAHPHEEKKVIIPNETVLDNNVKRVAVYWPLDDRYYDATILKRFENLCYIKYDDDEIEWLDLSKHKFKILT
jgi:hypothetical protein